MIFLRKKERDRKTSRRKSGGQSGHEGSNLKMVSNPTDTKEYPVRILHNYRVLQYLGELESRANVRVSLLFWLLFSALYIKRRKK